jgi:hypothetical protein
MKNRFFQYLLIILVIAIWGAIIYKIITKMNSKENINLPSSSILKNDLQKTEDEKYTVSGNYGHYPFVEIIGNELGVAVTKDEDSYNETNVYDNPVQPVNWPKIEFHGLIINNKNTEFKIALVKIENFDYLLKRKEEVRDIKVLALYPDSIVLSFKNNKKTFIKNE